MRRRAANINTVLVVATFRLLRLAGIDACRNLPRCKWATAS